MANRFTEWAFCAIENAPGIIGLTIRVVRWRGHSAPARGRADGICGRTCLLDELPTGETQAPGGLKVRRVGLAGDARGGPGIARSRVRLAELELIAVGDALARVMLTAPLLP
jgi:hypothetical protein